jgi:methionine sulfoxide reductase catalytic subunit
MLIKKTRAWDLPERMATPEAMFLNRRAFMGAGVGFAAILAGGGAGAAEDASMGLYPAKLNPKFADAGRPVTAMEMSSTFNNFYEFGTSKRISRAAEALPVSPWEIMFDGEIEQPFKISFDDLLKKMPLEERVVRHRCVEAWAMVVPWTGFPLSHLVAMAKPKADAKYVQFQTFNLPDIAPGQEPGVFTSYPWPYTEGLTVEEANNELAFMVTGAYGKPLPKAMGAPIRLHTPWKFGFKSIKSIVRVSFVKERPVSFWTSLQASEYGFWANVNPEVPHPRWSQASERMLGSDEQVPTQLFNGYGEWVAALYKGMETELLYM